MAATAAATAAAAAPAAFAASAAARPVSAASTIQGSTIQGGTATLDGFARPLLMAARHRTPRQIAWRMLTRKHWSAEYQYPYLRRLWDRESSWNIYAENPYSGAYGIPQAVPGSKMSSAGPDWENSARTQIRWGLDYIRERYNSPRRAWLNEEAYGWY